MTSSNRILRIAEWLIAGVGGPTLIALGYGHYLEIGGALLWLTLANIALFASLCCLTCRRALLDTACEPRRAPPLMRLLGHHRALALPGAAVALTAMAFAIDEPTAPEVVTPYIFAAGAFTAAVGLHCAIWMITAGRPQQALNPFRGQP